MSITKGMINLSDLPPVRGEELRDCMRHWLTGVAVATSCFEQDTHGMTVNSFVSLSLQPPLVSVTMASLSRTHALVEKSGAFAISILSKDQQALAERFAGRIPDLENRMVGIETFTLLTGAPLFWGGLAFMDCRVIHHYAMPLCTMFIGEVVAARVGLGESSPLGYIDRHFLGVD